MNNQGIMLCSEQHTVQKVQHLIFYFTKLKAPTFISLALILWIRSSCSLYFNVLSFCVLLFYACKNAYRLNYFLAQISMRLLTKFQVLSQTLSWLPL